MKGFIKLILKAAHECGVCSDWSDKVCLEIIEILKRDGVLTNKNYLEEIFQKHYKGVSEDANGEFYSIYDKDGIINDILNNNE